MKRLAMILALIVGSCSPVLADKLTVWYDRGGYLTDRQDQIREIEKNGTRVEIRGLACHSTCTMLLGVSDVCVAPYTIFGFHGPSYNGTPAPKHVFDYTSEIMASHYPKPIAIWFMEEARHELVGISRIKGKTLIAMGIEECY